MQCQNTAFTGKNPGLVFGLKPETLKKISEHTRLSVEELRFLSPEEARKLMIQRGVVKSGSGYEAKEGVLRCVEFFQKHPESAPRDVYLRAGRIIDAGEINKLTDEFLKEPFYVRVVNWFKNKFHGI